MAMDKSVQKTLIITAGVIIVALIAFAAANYFTFSKTVSSAGTSTIEVLPDFAAIYFSVDTKGATAKEASSMNSEIVSNMTGALIAAGISESEIKTQGFNVYPTYDYRNGNAITGYSASHSLKVQIPVADRGKIGGVIDAGVGAGAGISYINYELSSANQSKYKAEAIKLATEDARTKAEALAEGAGSRLGSLVSVSSSDFSYMPWLAASADSVKGESGAAIATQINPSEQEVSAAVTAVYRIS
jgi:uncharacterized protein YggE